jgi:hypothetical protein
MAATLKEYLLRNLNELLKLPKDKLVDDRYAKFRGMGVFETGIPPYKTAVPVVDGAGETRAES